MRRGRILILFALIVLFGVVAAYLYLRRGTGGGQEGGEATPSAPADTTYIVIAMQDIARGSTIPADGVGLSPFPRDMVVETMIEGDVNQVVGRYARQDIPRGAPVTTGMITRQAGDVLQVGSEAAVIIPPGMTAISVPINRLSAVGYALRDGDSVDVLISMLIVGLDETFQSVLPNDTSILVAPTGELLTALVCQEYKVGDNGPECLNPEPPPMGYLDTEEESDQPLFVWPSEPQRGRVVTQRLIQNATVLHVGSFTFEGEEEAAAVIAAQQQAAAQQQGTAAPAPTAPNPPDIITRLVTPQDALALNWAIRAGAQMSFTLRSPHDTVATETTSVTLQYLVQNYSITIPIQLPYGLEPRIDALIEPVLPNDGQPAAPER